MPPELKPAYGDLDEVRRLFEEYAAMLGVDLAFQKYAEELRTLPGAYALPRGRLYLAYDGGRPAGCIALRPLEGGNCEMKRLFVRPAFRGRGIGRALAERVIADARELGYNAMLLDTLVSLPAAAALYQTLGFTQTGPYRFNPQPDALFLRLMLRPSP